MVAILDQTGQPIRSRELAEPQTAGIATLHQSVALHPVRGLTPARLANILEAAEQGDLSAQADLFEDMEEKDTHIFAEMSKRKRALLTLDWDIAPPRGATAAEERLADTARELLAAVEIEDLILDMADGIGHAFACLEIAWARQGGRWLPGAIEHRPQRWFRLDTATRTEIRLRDNSTDGAPLRPFGWIVHVHRARSGYISRAGLHRVLAWPFLFKNLSVRDLAEFLEIYGLPLRLGTYPTGASDREKATLLRAVTAIGHAAAGIIPEGMAIEFKEAAKGAADPFKAMLDWCEASQSKAILGGTLTSSAQNTGLGSNLGDVHNEVRHDLLESDARQIAATLTRDLIYPLLALNAGLDSLQRCPRFVFDTAEAEDLAGYADALPKLAQSGMRIPAAWAHERLRIPQAEDDEPVLGGPAAAPVAARHAPGCPCCGTAALRADNAVGDPPSLIAERLDQEARPAMADWLAEIEAMLEAAENLAQFREMLLAAYGDLPEDRMAQTMAAALAVAQAAGRYDIEAG